MDPPVDSWYLHEIDFDSIFWELFWRGFFITVIVYHVTFTDFRQSPETWFIMDFP